MLVDLFNQYIFLEVAADSVQRALTDGKLSFSWQRCLRVQTCIKTCRNTRVQPSVHAPRLLVYGDFFAQWGGVALRVALHSVFDVGLILMKGAWLSQTTDPSCCAFLMPWAFSMVVSWEALCMLAIPAERLLLLDPSLCCTIVAGSARGAVLVVPGMNWIFNLCGLWFSVAPSA